MVESIDSLVARIEDSKARIQESQNSLSGLRVDAKAYYFNPLEIDERGFRFSFGIASLRGGSLFPETDALTFDVKDGIWEDANGNTREGFSGNVRVIRTKWDLANQFDLPEENVLDLEMGIGVVTLEENIGNDGLSLVGTANLAEVAITEGTRSAEIDTDETIRVGTSLGVGRGARMHWDDADNDGFREVGLGTDVPFLSLDVKTEDPLRTVMGITNGGLSDALLPEGNLTESVANGFGLSIKDENASNA
ncbi:hypothetical protein H6F88_26085 [Oculatella sp. FACHB-28]|uniref:hypothetical protein n=1 Tax=Oculatella sp. FACHB-28 TaxID=2692845 RepID=UPI001681C8AA|nr:hypothetical protein [Oculatella sp. FACHB-28]MBD2059425.1 hypothetical protein [Oculatella sp. FACHB-28]